MAADAKKDDNLLSVPLQASFGLPYSLDFIYLVLYISAEKEVLVEIWHQKNLPNSRNCRSFDMDIKYSERAEKQIKRIHKGDKKSTAMIIAAIESFVTHSGKQKYFDVKILKGKQGNFKRLRVGNYLVIFEDDDTIMLIYEVKHRQEAYHD